MELAGPVVEPSASWTAREIVERCRDWLADCKSRADNRGALIIHQISIAALSQIQPRRRRSTRSSNRSMKPRRPPGHNRSRSAQPRSAPDSHCAVSTVTKVTFTLQRGLERRRYPDRSIRPGSGHRPGSAWTRSTPSGPTTARLMKAGLFCCDAVQQPRQTGGVLRGQRHDVGHAAQIISQLGHVVARLASATDSARSCC